MHVQLHAAVARTELGFLRDPSFVWPGLDHRDLNIRLKAAACLGFVPSEEGARRLKRTVLADVDPGVRQVALWAYVFTGARDARELAATVAQQDRRGNLSQFAEQVLGSGFEGAAARWTL